MGWLESQKKSIARSREVLGAYFRQGLHELGAALYGPGTVAQHAEYGLVGTRTPGQVADGLRGREDAKQSQEVASPSVLQQHVDQARERRAEPELQRPEPHLERD